MSGNQNDSQTGTVRPTKKQRDLLTYIEQFIGEHGYSPSYREIMNGLSYTSVATVALHVNSLIGRGHLRKRDRSARSLEVVAENLPPAADKSNAGGAALKPAEHRWLVDKVEALFSRAETAAEPNRPDIAELQTVVAALQILGLEAAATSFGSRLVSMQQQAVVAPQSATPQSAEAALTETAEVNKRGA